MTELAAPRSPLGAIWQACRDLGYPAELAERVTARLGYDADVTPQAFLHDIRRLRQAHGDDPDICRVLDTALAMFGPQL